MELLLQLDTANTADFFTTFFRLPPSFWHGFLASKLSSGAWLGRLAERLGGCADGQRAVTASWGHSFLHIAMASKLRLGAWVWQLGMRSLPLYGLAHCCLACNPARDPACGLLISLPPPLPLPLPRLQSTC